MSHETDYPTSDIPSWQPAYLRVPLYNEPRRPQPHIQPHGEEHGVDNRDDENRDVPGSHVIITDLA